MAQLIVRRRPFFGFRVMVGVVKLGQQILPRMSNGPFNGKVRQLRMQIGRRILGALMSCHDVAAALGVQLDKRLDLLGVGIRRQSDFPDRSLALLPFQGRPHSVYHDLQRALALANICSRIASAASVRLFLCLACVLRLFSFHR